MVNLVNPDLHSVLGTMLSEIQDGETWLEKQVVLICLSCDCSKILDKRQLKG